MVPTAEVRQLRCGNRNSRITLYTSSVVLTLPGFKRRDRREAVAAMVSGFGLVPTSSSFRADYYVRAGESSTRFDGDWGRFKQIDDRADSTTVRSPFWGLHSVLAFVFAWGWAAELARWEPAGGVETLALGSGAVLAFAAGVRFLLMRLTFDEGGVTVVNFWQRRRRIGWAQIAGVTTSEAPGRWSWPVVAFETHRTQLATATACLTKAQAQGIAALVATWADPMTSEGSAVHADDLMPTGRPASEINHCVSAGRFVVLERGKLHMDT